MPIARLESENGSESKELRLGEKWEGLES